MQHTYGGPAGTVSYSPGQLTVTGDVPWLVTHPKNVAVADHYYNAGNLDALDDYLELLYREGIAWEMSTRRLQDLTPPATEAS